MLSRQMSFNTLVRRNAVALAGQLAFSEGAEHVSHRELDRRTNRLAHRMLAAGTRPGDRIAILMPDGIRFMEVMIAAGKIGAIAVLLNWRLAAPEIARIIDDAAPVAIYHADRFAGLVPDRPGMIRHVVSDDPVAEAQYRRWIEEGPDAAPAVAVDGQTPLFMMFTSGTTGRPKGCLQSHEAVAMHGLAMAARRGFSHLDRSLSCNPLFHVAGLGHVATMLATGGATCFSGREGGPLEPLEVAANERCTTTMLAKVVRDGAVLAPPELRTRLRFRTITGGSGMTDPADLAYVRDTLGALLVGGYGQTEAMGFMAMIDYPDMVEHPSAVGWPMPHFDMAVLDAAGQAIDDPEAEGEIGVRGPSVMLGYWNNPEASEAALGTGWLRTGDLGRRDRLGLFHMLGRAKELIKTGGENVYPLEVEGALRGFPGIADLAVAGVADAKWGEAIKLFVVPQPGATIEPAAVVAACRARIAGYKRPRYLEMVDTIPRDDGGKIRRYLLSERPVTLDQSLD